MQRQFSGMFLNVVRVFNRKNKGKWMTLKRLPLLAAALALITGGCTNRTRGLEAQLERVSGQLHTQQRQLQTLSSQSTNLEPRLNRLETASPGVGQIMTRAQLDFAKLYFAGQARNWDLAEFERGEVAEDLKAAVALRPKERGVNIAGIMGAFSNGPLTSLQNAIAVYDWPLFRKAYRESVKMCNACHQATGRPFIVITVPTHPPVFNQRWEPANLFGTNNGNPHEQ